jgi:hypothetical protein
LARLIDHRLWPMIVTFGGPLAPQAVQRTPMRRTDGRIEGPIRAMIVFRGQVTL